MNRLKKHLQSQGKLNTTEHKGKSGAHGKANTTVYKSKSGAQRNKFRPQTFSEYIGQTDQKSVIKDAVKSAIKRNEPIEHMLISSAGPGLGKSTISRIIARESRREIIETTASSLEKPHDIFSLLKRANQYVNPILFIDEIHSIKSSIAELLHTPMEDYGASIPLNEEIGDGRQRMLEVKPFTLIGATAGEQGKLPKPFLDRFELTVILERYSIANLKKIIDINVKKIEVSITPAAQAEIANRSCYTPRIANSLIKRIRNYGIARDMTSIDKKSALIVFKKHGIDSLGVDKMGRSILKALYESHKMKLGLASLAQSVMLDIKTIQSLYEPQLIMHNLIAYQPNGRALTQKGEDHIKKNINF